MKETDNIDFVLDNFPRNVKEALEFEKSFIECRMALYIEDEQLTLSEEEEKNVQVLKQYFGALDKLKIFTLIHDNVEATVVEMSKLFLQ
jgi:type I restriction-modification system DNA methylase subunit